MNSVHITVANVLRVKSVHEVTKSLMSDFERDFRGHLQEGERLEKWYISVEGKFIHMARQLRDGSTKMTNDQERLHKEGRCITARVRARVTSRGREKRKAMKKEAKALDAAIQGVIELREACKHVEELIRTINGKLSRLAMYISGMCKLLDKTKKLSIEDNNEMARYFGWIGDDARALQPGLVDFCVEAPQFETTVMVLENDVNLTDQLAYEDSYR